MRFLTLLPILILVQTAVGQNLSEAEQRLADYIRDHNEVAIDLLERSVNINSGTMNHEGVREVGRVFQRELDALGFNTHWEDLPDSLNRGGHLIAERQGGSGKRILLIGHLDTVFEPESEFQHFTREADTATGPGVADMKGGNVIIVQALRALNHIGALEDAQIIVAFTGDEEKPGRPVSVSRRSLIDAARRSDVALGFEGGAWGSGVVARRGSSSWRLEVRGRTAHSSNIFSDAVGSGAIFEAARILTGFHENVKGEEYLSFNPGVILGGTEVEFNSESSRGAAFGKTNVVAQDVVVEGGLRFISEDQKTVARMKMREIVESGSLPGTSATITFSDSYPAMAPTEGNYNLLAKYSQVSQDLGYEPIEPYDPGARGASDISFVSFIDAIGGLGIYGSLGHTPGEMADLTSLITASARASILIYRLLLESR